MARIRNVELPKEKRTVIGLTYIYDGKTIPKSKIS